MTTYNRQWLREQVASYLHDSEVSPLVDTWIDIGTKRISQVLRCWEMEAELTLGLAFVADSGVLDGGTAAGGGVIIDGGDAFNLEDESQTFIQIDPGIKDILGVQWNNNEGQWTNLVSVSRHRNAGIKRTGTPAWYLVENRRIYPYPFSDGSYRVQVIEEVVIPPTTDDVVDALVSYPFVFLNAALTEAFDWKQDSEMNQRYENKWFTEAVTITNNYRQERSGESLAMRAV